MVYSNNFGQTRVGVRIVTQVVNAIDADATAFIAAAGITDLTQAAAISTLVNDLKTYGIWSKMKALYPFVGGSATSHKFNLKDPRDLDAAYRLVFNGGWVHSSNGAQPNGTTAYADSKYNPNINGQLNSAHISYYSRTNTSSSNAIDMGALSAAPGNYHHMHIRYTGDLMFGLINTSSAVSVSNNISQGLFISSRINSTNVSLYRNNSNIGNVSLNSTTQPNNNIYIGSGNITNSPQQYSSKESAFSSIGDGLTDTEAANFYTSVQKFQTTLGRQVGTPYVSDSDAQAFLNAASITDTTQATAINTLVTDLKAAGIWTKMKVIYPFIGGNATSHKFNLKDPRDLDAAYRLQFNGGWTHNSNGVTPNGSNGFARTFFVDTNLSINSVSYSIYNRSNTPQNVIYSDFGYFRYNSSYVSNYFTTNYAPYGWGGRVNSWTGASATRTDYRGFYNGNRTNSTDFNFFLNGTKALTQNDNTSGKLQTGYQFHLGCLFIDGQYYSDWSTNNYAFAHISDGLTDTEAVALHRAVQKYQTTLGRQIDVPLVSDSDAQAFLTAASITSYTQANAVNTFVVDLKSAGVWTKMKAIYPFVGGTATSHKFNLKDPRDVDAAFRLVFTGGWTHTSTGALPNGSNAYADTKWIQSINGTLNNQSLSNYNRTNNTFNGVDIGARVGTGTDLSLAAYGGSPLIGRINTYLDGAQISGTPTGLFQVTRTGGSTQRVFLNTLSSSSNITTSTGVLTVPIYIGGFNWSGWGIIYNNRETALASIGDGLTDGEATSFYTAVQKFQTSLGRQVGTPVYNTNGLVLNLDAGNANSYPGTGTTWFDLASGNNGTLVNEPTYNSTNGGSINFDGVNDNVTFGSNCFGVALNDTISEFTINVWVNFNSFPNNNHAEIVSWWATGTQTYSDGFLGLSTVSYLGFTNANPTIRFGDGWQDTGVRFNSSTDSNKWWNITSIKTANNAYIYLNGVLVSTKGSTLSWGFNNVLNIGSQFTAGEYLNGKLSSVSLYNRALSATEVLQNFNNTRGRFGL